MANALREVQAFPAEAKGDCPALGMEEGQEGRLPEGVPRTQLCWFQPGQGLCGEGEAGSLEPGPLLFQM